MTALSVHLAQVQDVAVRVRERLPKEAADPHAFSNQVVKDLGTLAEALGELIAREASRESD